MPTFVHAVVTGAHREMKHLYAIGGWSTTLSSCQNMKNFNISISQ